MKQPSLRAQLITRRTYNRPTDDTGKNFESWEETVDRVVNHQRWLWGRSAGEDSNYSLITDELEELRKLMLERKVLMSGRSLWLGGTQVARSRESSMFNCSFTYVETIMDVVDCLWLLLQGCGVGFKPVVGSLTGFQKPIKEIEVIRSKRTAKGGVEHNVETFENGVWTIKVGDSAEAWAKSIGKLAAHKFPAHKLVLDFSEIRPAGERLKGYGWISSGDAAIAKAYVAIANTFNRRAGSLLTRIDILDVVNWLGTILSSRRSAEIALFSVDEDEWEEFAIAKRNWWVDNIQRAQSNNSLLFNSKPAQEAIERIFQMMVDAGGSEPGFINGQSAAKRAPWFKGVNPCAEILLGNKSFC
jgi:adenosylcobalamin-dependent ribonucleoside-triphosphate reductase